MTVNDGQSYTTHGRLAEIQQAIEDTLDTFAATKESVAYCLSEGGQLIDGRLLTMLLTTSDVCRSAAEIIAIEAPIFQRTCAHTAEVCEFTADLCDHVGEGDIQLAVTARTCRMCAESCRVVAELDFKSSDGRFAYT